MYIESLHITDFGGCRDRDITFGPGVNIIEGKNESGKSTLAAFITFIFYGFSDKAERQRYYSWGSDRACGSACIASGEKRYRIEREHIENSGGRVQIVDLDSNLPVFEGMGPDEVFLGVSADIFRQTAFVGQTTGGYINGAKVSASIENILFSADESVDTSKALKRLDDARVLLQHKRGKGGKIYELSCERDELIKRLDAAKSANSGIIEKEGTLRETLKTIEQNEERLKRHKELLEYYEAAKKYRTYKKYITLKKKASEIESLITALKQSYTCEGFLPDDEYIERLGSLVDDMDRLDEAANELEREANSQRARNSELFEMSLFIDKVHENGGIDEVVKKFKSICSRRTVLTVFAVISFILGAALGVITLLFHSRIDSLLIYGGLSAFALVILGLIFIILVTRQNINRDEFLADLDIDTPGDFHEAVSRFVTDENRLSIHNSRIRDLEEKAERLLMARKDKEDLAMAEAIRWGKSSYTDALKKAREVRKLINENTAEAEKYAMARDAFREQAEGIDPFAIKEILAGRPYTEDSFDSDEVEAAQREDSFYRKATECLREKAAELEKELAVLYATVEDPTALGDRINELTRQITELTQKHNAYVMAYEKLTEASENMRLCISPRLADGAAELMSQMTDGRYTTLGVTKDLDMKYEAEGATRDLIYMSRGTRDLAYYSLRIALVGLLYKKELPPIVFDESFASLDDKRLSNMLGVVSRLSQEGLQSLVFTSQSRDAASAGDGFRYIKL